MHPVELDVATTGIIELGKQKFVAGSNIIRQKPNVGINGFYLSPLHALNNLGQEFCRRGDMLFLHHLPTRNGIKKCKFFQNRMPEQAEPFRNLQRRTFREKLAVFGTDTLPAFQKITTSETTVGNHLHASLFQPFHKIAH